jgi:hypothetical protein
VLTLDPSSRGSISYKLLATEVEERYALGETMEATPASVATPGPGGRGYGHTTAEPDGLEDAWPREHVWREPIEAGRER